MKDYSTREKSREIQAAISDLFLEMRPKLTVRQIYYALTVRGIVAKTENGYRQVGYHVKELRKQNVIPYEWIADNTRWKIQQDTSPDLKTALLTLSQTYRRSFWVGQPHHVEIWVEKDALASVISPVTEMYDVPLYVSRGYGSLTFIHECAEFIKSTGKPTFVYHFGDYDPSGVDAANSIRRGLEGHGANVTFTRVAITPQQIVDLALPSRETKLSDPRTKNWGGGRSVELDALPAPVLRTLVKRCILQHITEDEINEVLRVQDNERRQLYIILNNFVLDQNCYDPGLGDCGD